MIFSGRDRYGFTIVELLIVVVVIAILAAITTVAYNGIQNNAKNAQVVNEIRAVAKLIEMHKVKEGVYPSTGGLSNVYADANCTLATDDTGYEGAEWVPGLGASTGVLPQNPGLVGTGNGTGGCYTYSSDGVNYVLSAWNAKRGGPSTDLLYRRLGWREAAFFGANGYNCNHPNIGGNASGTYNIASDYYKYSFTISSLTNCNETPPPGA